MYNVYIENYFYVVVKKSCNYSFLNSKLKV